MKDISERDRRKRILERIKVIQPRMHETFKRPKTIPSETEYDRTKQKRQFQRELSEELRRVASILLGKYVRVPGKGKKPTLWYWENPEGKRFLVDQKSNEEA